MKLLAVILVVVLSVAVGVLLFQREEAVSAATPGPPELRSSFRDYELSAALQPVVQSLEAVQDRLDAIERQLLFGSGAISSGSRTPVMASESAVSESTVPPDLRMELQRIDTALRSIQKSLEDGTGIVVPPSPDLFRRFPASDHGAAQALIDRHSALPKARRERGVPPEEIAYLSYEEMLTRFGRPDQIGTDGRWWWLGLPGDPGYLFIVGFRGGMVTSFTYSRAH